MGARPPAARVNILKINEWPENLSCRWYPYSTSVPYLTPYPPNPFRTYQEAGTFQYASFPHISVFQDSNPPRSAILKQVSDITFQGVKKPVHIFRPRGTDFIFIVGDSGWGNSLSSFMLCAGYGAIFCAPAELVHLLHFISM